jgi:L-lactate dehydrogenase complex protein LldG
VSSFHPGQEVRLPIALSATPYSREKLANIQLSASRASWGVADTGTIVHSTTSTRGRLLSILPPAHLVFLSERVLLNNLQQLFEVLRPGEDGSAFTFVTGPSQTADIEKKLVRGVHGPQKWFVLLTE